MPTQNPVQTSEAVSTSVETDHALFRKNALLAGINDETYSQIAEKIDIIRCKPNDIIFAENNPGDSLYLIARGSVKISKKGRAGQQETLAYLMEQDFFGEMAMVDSAKRSAQAAAVDHVVVGRIDQRGWDLLLHLAPHQVMNNFNRSVTQRLRHNNQHFIEEVMRNERLALIGSTISSIVHDMNNPISSILCGYEVIRRNNQDALIDEAAELIRDAVRKMETMTQELIDFSRGHTHLSLESISVDTLVHALETDLGKYRPYIEIQFDVSYHGEVAVDRHRLLRVFGNLIRNACEAMSKSAEKILRFSVRRTDARVHIEISDTGCGIPAQLLPRIFEPFVTHGKSNGTGLGLAISKAVVEAHNGSISVKSSNRGTTFQIDLPVGT